MNILKEEIQKTNCFENSNEDDEFTEEEAELYVLMIQGWIMETIGKKEY